MEANQFYRVRLGLMTHNLNCPDPDGMFYAERARLVREKLNLLHDRMMADGLMARIGFSYTGEK